VTDFVLVSFFICFSFLLLPLSTGGKSIVGKVPGKLGERCVSKGSDHVQCTFCPNVELDWCQ